MLVKMKKLNVVGLIAEKQKVLDALRTTGCFELSSVKNNLVGGQTTAESSIDPKVREQWYFRLHNANKAISFVTRSQKAYPKEIKAFSKLVKKGIAKPLTIPAPATKNPMFFYREDVSSEQLRAIGSRDEELMAEIDRIEKLEARYNEILAQLKQCPADLKRLAPFVGFDSKLSEIADTKHIFMLLGTFRPKKDKNLEDILKSSEGYSLKVVQNGKKGSAVFVSGALNQKEHALEVLKDFGFSQCELTLDKTPKDAISSIEAELDSLHAEKMAILRQMDEYGDKLLTLKMFADYALLEIEAIEALKDIGETKKTYSIEGWIPADKEQYVLSKVNEASKLIEAEVVDAAENEIPPTHTNNPALVAPFESVTNMFSPPNYKEKDPNLIMGFFFFFFFGIMIGDAIYGIALAALTFLLLKRFRMESGFKRLIMVICMGGVSAIFWGIIFGSWLGLENNGKSIIPGLINITANSFDFLLITLGLGVVQLFVGFLLKFIELAKKKQYMDAMCAAGWKLLLFIGFIISLPNVLVMFEKQLTLIVLPKLHPVISFIGLFFVGVAIIGMIAFNGRKKSNIAARLLSGFGSLYDIVNLLSDILSYCRLFGLALSGAIIGSVANTLAVVMIDMVPGAGYVIGFVIATFFHIFNLALACLSAYIHNARLQFVEFFGKFYEGGGRLFRPMGGSTKYVAVKEMGTKN